MNAETKILHQKTIIITGASRGIGKAIAMVCAREGARVGINYFKSRSEAESLAETLRQNYNTPSFLLPFDVRSYDSIVQACSPLLKDGIQIHGWVNNAAVNLPGLLLTQTEERIREQIDTNLMGTLNSCHFILKHMLEKKEGAIVNMASITNRKVTAGQSVYAATKGAISALTKALACEYRRKGIRVNYVEPGPIETDMLRPTLELIHEKSQNCFVKDQLGQPEEIAEIVAFLLSHRASFINGSGITADGGYSLT